MRKIGTRIILTVLICSIGMSIVVGATSIFRSMDVITREAKEGLFTEGRMYASEFNEDLILYETIVSNIHQVVDATIETTQLKEDNYLSNYSGNILAPIISRINKETRKSRGIYIAFDPRYTGRTEGAWVAIDEDGNEQYSLPSELSDKDESDPESAWYFNAIKTGEGSWSDPFINDAGLYIMTYAIPIKISNEIIGVIGIDLGVDELIKQIDEIKLYDTGYIFMLSKDYDYLIHPTLDQTSNLNTMSDGQYSYIVDEMESKDAGVIDTMFAGERKIMVFAKLYDEKIIMLTIPKSEILKEMYHTIYIILGVIGLASLLSIFISLILGKMISNPIILVTQMLEKTSQLDLTNIEETRQIRLVSRRKDEVGSIFRATVVLREEMRKVIGAIEETMGNIIQNTDGLTTATGETSESINEVARSIEELARAAMEQATDAETGSHKLNKLSDEIRGAVENGEMVVESSLKAQRINEDGSKAMEGMVERFQVVNQTTHILSENIDSLQYKSQSIGNIVGIIMGISEQTNLLALNAAIEAARAGEVGRGFAVVADEIRKLSAQTGDATKNIEDILKSILSEVENTKGNMDISENALEDANQSLTQSKDAFEEISVAMSVTIDSIGQLEQKLQLVDNDKEDVMLAIQNISAITEETAASTEELSASTEEQAATMETISNSTDNLAGIIQNLDELVHMFTI